MPREKLKCVQNFLKINFEYQKVKYSNLRHIMLKVSNLRLEGIWYDSKTVTYNILFFMNNLIYEKTLIW